MKKKTEVIKKKDPSEIRKIKKVIDQISDYDQFLVLGMFHLTKIENKMKHLEEIQPSLVSFSKEVLEKHMKYTKQLQAALQKMDSELTKLAKN